MEKEIEELLFLKKICQTIQTYPKFRRSSSIKMSIDEVQNLSLLFLDTIDKDYKDLLERALEEERDGYPYVYIMKKISTLEKNESSCFHNVVYFCPTGTIDDVYLLIHEFTHLLTNQKRKVSKSYSYDKKYREIPSILSEFLVKDYLENKGFYTKNRFNEIVRDSKAYLYKKSLQDLWRMNNDSKTDQQKLIEKYKITEEELLDDIWKPKSISTEDERKYLFGYLYAIKLWKENPKENYIEMIKQLQTEKISLEEIFIEEAEDLIESAYQFCKKR